MGRWTGKTCRLSVMLALTGLYFVVEIVTGYATKSTALVADSFHMLSDVLAQVIALVCMKMAKRRSENNTFGWVRAEVLGALVNAVFLLALCFSIFVEALKRLYEPELIKKPVDILIVGSVGFVINLVGIFMFHGHASMKGKAKQEDVDECKPTRSEDAKLRLRKIGRRAAGHDKAEKKGGASGSQLNMHGVFLHILGDTLGSVIVMINAVVMWQVDNDAVRKYLDPSLSLVMGLIICGTTIPLLKESALILLQTVPTHINVRDIKARLLQNIDGVRAIHEFHVWRLSGNKIVASAHITCRDVDDYMKVAEQVKQFFHDEGIHSTTIQPEFVEMTWADIRTAGSIVSASVDPSIDDHCMIKCPPSDDCSPTTRCCPPDETSVDSETSLRSEASADHVSM